MKVLQSRNLLAPYLIVFVYVFMPMLFTLDGDVEVVSSGGPAAESVPVSDLPERPRFEISESVLLHMPADQRFVVSSNYRNEIERPNYLNYASATLPVYDPVISSDFGWRVPPCDACSSDHRGIDFVPGEGEPVIAVLDGVVAEAGVNQGYGYWVKIEHIVPVTEDVVERWDTVYAHLKANSIPENVFVGAIVSKGQRLGAVGSTGISTGPHLHFELHVNGEAVDPLPIIAENQIVRHSQIAWK